MNPKHESPSKTQRTAHAPYNFVPLPEKVVLAELLPDQDTYHLDRHTGHIDCTLTTQSPLYTRTMLNPDFFRKWVNSTRALMQDDNARGEYAEFFHLDDTQRPVIPGSSLRGMVRALIEIVSYGKVQWVTNEPLVFRAVADSTSLGKHYRSAMQPTKIRAGYMERNAGEWQIRPARPIEGAAFARIRRDKIPSDLPAWPNSKNACENAKIVYVQIRPIKAGLPVVSRALASHVDSDLSEAVLVKTGDMPGKRKEFVFGLPDDSSEAIQIPDGLLRAYHEQVTDQQRRIVGDQGVLRESQPVFYLVDNGSLKFFGHCMMFRLPFENCPLDLVPSVLRQESDIDLAEAIFGFAKSDNSCAGRVFFSDAKVESAVGSVWLSHGPMSPRILSSPKPTTFQHYLTQPNPDDKNQLNHYDSKETVVRGHKLFWHQGSIEQDEIREAGEVHWAKDSLHTAMKPVKADVTFSFQIRFENLSAVELGALLWALQLPGQPGKQYCLKLGMGKPLGMGSVKFMTTLQVSNRRERYTRLFDTDGWNQAESRVADMQQFLDLFETYVLERMASRERGGSSSLRDVPRIKMLFKLLEWPGPSPGSTSYMAIDPTNDYKDRPVLPDPLSIK